VFDTIEAFQTSGIGEWPSVGAMLAEADAHRTNQELFELHVSDYLLLTRCQVLSCLYKGKKAPCRRTCNAMAAFCMGQLSAGLEWPLMALSGARGRHLGSGHWPCLNHQMLVISDDA
jgi:hypothetical protein